VDKDYDVDSNDFARLAAAWKSGPGDATWNRYCDISDPNDEIIDELDLKTVTENWLAEK